jgi:hypothetical protein
VNSNRALAPVTSNTVQPGIGGATLNPFFAGLSAALLYKIDVTIPAGLGKARYSGQNCIGQRLGMGPSAKRGFPGDAKSVLTRFVRQTSCSADR